jgi:uncharacterized protein (DUF885 family)
LLSETEITDAVDRCIAQPGASLAAPAGKMKIDELRRKAERQLAANFDVRQFHEQVAGGGAMPWSVLQLKINRWIASQQ